MERLALSEQSPELRIVQVATSQNTRIRPSEQPLRLLGTPVVHDLPRTARVHHRGHTVSLSGWGRSLTLIGQHRQQGRHMPDAVGFGDLWPHPITHRLAGRKHDVR
jgi:hypothetical protein